MQEAGATLFKHYKEISFMGFVEVVMNLRTVSKVMNAVQKDLIAYKPDVLILVDFAGFNLRMAKYAKAHGLKVFYYISPKIWAWNQKRAYKVKANVDRMFVIMPFEKDFYAKFGYTAVDYIGNPLLDAVTAFQPDADFKTTQNLTGQLVAVLPGSRKQEVTVMVEKIPAVAKRFPDMTFVVAGVKNLNASLYEPLKGIANVRLLFEQTYNILSVTDTAIVTSGTATLETALFKVPQVVVYRASAITYQIVKRLIRVPYISLVNLIASEGVVKELIQDEFNEELVVKELSSILPGGAKREQVLQGYDRLHILLGKPGASQKAAELMMEHL